jgi:hypothetical protein
MKTVARFGLVMMVLATAAQAAADPVPMRLDDPTPRWVSVRFEDSGSDAPGAIDVVYSPAYPAWFAPDPAGSRVRVTVTGPTLERMIADQDPVPGSFSDFVWEFDVETGDVRVAEFTGKVRQNLEFGIARWRVDADIHATLSTREVAGYTPSRNMLGLRIYRYCDGDGPACTPMRPHPYAPESGYVHAVGVIEATAGPTHVRSYCPLGEAVFTELRSDGPPAGLPAAALGAVGTAAPLTPSLR